MKTRFIAGIDDVMEDFAQALFVTILWLLPSEWVDSQSLVTRLLDGDL